jgi:NADP-dependent 3-hydroxy acid dehydrogenase YdfG
MSKKVAVVTGASSGIGAATAIALSESGYRVLAAARRVEKLAELAAAHSNIGAVELDVTDQGSVDRFVESLAGQEIDLLVNNAGGAFDASSVANSDPAIWSKTYEVNVVGTVRMVKACLPLLQKAGHIVIVTSTAAYAAYENGGSYVAAKAAELSLARTLRLELNGLPIRVTEIAPGMVKTEEFAKVRLGGDSEKAAKVYEGVAQPLTAEDIAESIRWSVMLPAHVNIDSLVIRPIAQAANHKVHRVL